MVGETWASVEFEIGKFAMTEKFLSQNKLDRLLRDLRKNQVESQNIDGKVTLNLKELGDRATLIRHVSAIANTGQDGYIIIGVENKTWNSIGIPSDSLLADPDETQKQINQILTGRIDPPISVSYRTYVCDSVILGVIFVPSGNLPYIISIPDDRYGGKKSDSIKESYIYKGVIYFRRGSDSVIANRQGEIFAILEARRNIVGIIGSLGLIAFVVSVGVGVGVSLTKFPDVYVPAILGGVWGLLVGFLLNQRVIDSVGRFPKGSFHRILRSSLGPLIGAIVGAWLSYSLVGVVLSGKVMGFDPFSMGLFIAPLVLVINFLPAVLVLLVIEYVPLGKWIARIIKRFRGG